MGSPACHPNSDGLRNGGAEMRKPSEIATAFAPRELLGEKKSLFFVGIGGAGMSGLVPLALEQGFKVSGSDATASPVTDSLGVPVTIGHHD
jgi:hypothetical protein